MNAAWIDPSFSLRFTTALVHFLWQGCAVGAVVVVGGFALRRAPAQWRYVLNVAALLVMAACLPATFVLLDGSDGNAPAANDPGSRSSHPVTTPVANVALPDPADNSEVETALAMPHVETVPDVITTDHGITPSDSKPPLASWFTVLYFVGVALAETYGHETTVLGDLVTGGGIIERIEGDVIWSSPRTLSSC